MSRLIISRRVKQPNKQCWWVFISLVCLLKFEVPVQAASFDCGKATSKVEQLICKESAVSSLDDELSIAYQWALMRVDEKQKVIREQRHWLKEIRDVCQDKSCLMKAYLARVDELSVQVETKGCYTLQPIPDSDGKKVRPIEQVCEVMEINLNKFCDQPPVACGLKIAPEYQHQIFLPNWAPLNADANRGLIEKVIRAPWQDAHISQQEKNALWEEERLKIDQAFSEKRLSFSVAQIDLYNLGKRQLSYRLDYGDCEARNPQFKNREQWGYAINSAPVQIQPAPGITRELFRQYFPLDRSPLSEVFLYGGKTYSFWMHGKSNPSEEGPHADNWLVIDRLGLKIYPGDTKLTLFKTNACRFSYQITSEGPK